MEVVLTETLFVGGVRYRKSLPRGTTTVPDEFFSQLPKGTKVVIGPVEPVGSEKPDPDPEPMDENHPDQLEDPSVAFKRALEEEANSGAAKDSQHIGDAVGLSAAQAAENAQAERLNAKAAKAAAQQQKATKAAAKAKAKKRNK